HAKAERLHLSEVRTAPRMTAVATFLQVVGRRRVVARVGLVLAEDAAARGVALLALGLAVGDVAGLALVGLGRSGRRALAVGEHHALGALRLLGLRDLLLLGGGGRAGGRALRGLLGDRRENEADRCAALSRRFLRVGGGLLAVADVAIFVLSLLRAR